MKSSNPEKSIKNLENQRVDSEKIQGGLSVAQPVSLTKNQKAGIQSSEQKTTVASGFTSDIKSDGSILNRRGIRVAKASRNQ